MLFLSARNDSAHRPSLLMRIVRKIAEHVLSVRRRAFVAG